MTDFTPSTETHSPAYQLTDADRSGEYPVQPPPRPAKPRRRWPLVAAGAAAFVLVIVGISVFALDTKPVPKPIQPVADIRMGGGCTSPGQTDKTIAGQPVICTNGIWVTTEPVAEPVAAPPAVVEPPKAADFRLAVKILRKQCFGSAGCNVTYRIDVTYLGAAPLQGTWLVTYQVSGVEDGPAINTFTVEADSAQVESEEIASTPSSKTKLTAKATDVTEG